MKERLRFIISSGGTEVPLDDVRILTNKSRGTTGALLAEEAIRRGHHVDFVHSTHSKKPFSHHFQTNFEEWMQQSLTTDFGSGMLSRESLEAKMKAALDQIVQLSGSAHFYPVKDYDHYRSQLLELVRQPSELKTAVILAMAASDYGPEKVTGKISSTSESLDLHLKTLNKIIPEVKKQRENVFLVGFKLLTEDSSPDLLLQKAQQSMERDHQDLTVANLVNADFQPVKTIILNPEGEPVILESRGGLFGILINEIESRI